MYKIVKADMLLN